MSIEINLSKLYVRLLLFAFWLIGGCPFFGQEFALSAYEFLSSKLLIMADAIIIFLGLKLIKHKLDWSILISFIILAFFSTCILNDESLLQFFNGIRQYISLILLIPIFRYFIGNSTRREIFIHTFDKNLYIFLWLQIPCSIIQCAQYGAFDQVGGSLGWMMSGEMSTLVYLISLYFMRKRWNNSLGYIANMRKNAVLLFLLLPSFLNETKVSFIYLMLYFFFVLPMDRKMILRILVLTPCVILILVIMGAFYSLMAGGKSGVFTQEYIENYMYGDADGRDYVEFILENGSDVIEDDQGDIARFIKLSAVPVIMEERSHAFLCGFGVGQFKGGTVLEPTKFAKEYSWLFQGTKMMIYLIALELGILGIIWYLLFWILYIKGNKTKQKDTPMLIYLMILVAIISIYNVAFCNLAFGIIFMYIFYNSVDHIKKEDIELSHEKRHLNYNSSL